MRYLRIPLSLNFFFSPISIEEPTFKEVIVVYSPKQESTESRYGRSILMKGFENVPIADMEVVLPNSGIDLKIKLRDKFQIASMILIGIIMIFMKFISGNNSSWIASLTILFCLGLRIFQVWSGMRNARQRNIDEMTRMLYSKSLASNNALLYYLIQSSSEQELKKTLLGHFFLWNSGKSLTKLELDDLCQTFLQNNLGIFIDFDISTSIKNLLSRDLITKTKREGLPAIYSAKPLSESLYQLDHIWDNLYNYHK